MPRDHSLLRRACADRDFASHARYHRLATVAAAFPCDGHLSRVAPAGTYTRHGNVRHSIAPEAVNRILQRRRTASATGRELAGLLDSLPLAKQARTKSARPASGITRSRQRTWYNHPMRLTLKVFCLSLLAVALLAGSAMSFAHPSTNIGKEQTARAKQGKVSTLFVTEGPSAQLAPVEGKAGTYTFTMPIHTAKQPVIWFTDRPARDAGTLSMRNFVGLWSAKGTNTFTTDPPNVAIVYTSGGKEKTFIATMTSPVIIPGTAMAGTAKLQATMTAVPEEQLATYAKGKGKLATHAKKAQRNAMRFPASSVIVRTPSVFVDDNTNGTSITISTGVGPTGCTVTSYNPSNNLACTTYTADPAYFTLVGIIYNYTYFVDDNTNGTSITISPGVGPTGCTVTSYNPSNNLACTTYTADPAYFTLVAYIYNYTYGQ